MNVQPCTSDIQMFGVLVESYCFDGYWYFTWYDAMKFIFDYYVGLQPLLVWGLQWTYIEINMGIYHRRSAEDEEYRRQQEEEDERFFNILASRLLSDDSYGIGDALNAIRANDPYI